MIFMMTNFLPSFSEMPPKKQSVFWTDMTANKYTGNGGEMYWKPKVTMKEWTLIVKKNDESPFELQFCQKVGEEWIESALSRILKVIPGSGEAVLDFTLLEGGEERLMSIDLPIHKFV